MIDIRPYASLAHREFLGGEFWRRIPAYANVGEAEFLEIGAQLLRTLLPPAKAIRCSTTSSTSRPTSTPS